MRLLPLRDLPFRRKLTLLMLLTSAGVLTLTGVGFAVYEIAGLRRQMIRELEIVARIIGANSTAALSFDDPDAAGEILASLGAHDDLAVAALYRADGTPLATYRRAGDHTRTAPGRPPDGPWRPAPASSAAVSRSRARSCWRASRSAPST
jgi:hypothetical protein